MSGISFFGGWNSNETSVRIKFLSGLSKLMYWNFAKLQLGQVSSFDELYSSFFSIFNIFLN